MTDTDARFWHPRLRINRVLRRVKLHTRWSAESGQGRRSSDDATLAGVTLFDALQAFFQEHQYCGDLDGGVEAMTDSRGRLLVAAAMLVRVVTFS